MTTSTVILRDQDGATLFTFNPVPGDVNFRMDNAPGKMPMDLPSYHRPTLFWMGSQSRKLVIKAVLLGTSFTSSTIIDQVNELVYVMSGAASSYLSIVVPIGTEDMTGTPHTYSTSDSAKDAAAFANGDNYMNYYCHPDDFSIDKITANICYITLSFSEVDDVLDIG